MDTGPRQLVVRQHERRACSLAATLRIAVQHAGTVEFSRSVGDGSGTVQVTVVDVSQGGAGLETQVFLPRGAGVVLTVCAGSEVIEMPLRVQRASMISREPRYYLGLAFAGDAVQREATLGKLQAIAGAASQEAA